MKKGIVLLLFIFLLSPSVYADEILRSRNSTKVKIEPNEETTIDLKIPYTKYFRVIKAKFELSNIHQDLSSQYNLEISNKKGENKTGEDVGGKTWAIQEIIAPNDFELSKIVIDMNKPLEEEQELLVCDKDLYEKTRGVIEYDASKRECFIVVDPTVQIYEGEHFFLVVKLAETPLAIDTSTKENLFALYTDYPDGFKERDPFPEYLKRNLIKSTATLVYRLYSHVPLDMQPAFQIKIADDFSHFWEWGGEEEKAIISEKKAVEAMNIYLIDKRRDFEYEDEITLPLIFMPDFSTFPIELELTSWEIEIKIAANYFNEIRSLTQKIFKEKEETLESLNNQIQSIWDSYKEEEIDEVRDQLKQLISDVYYQREQAVGGGEANEIKGLMGLAEDLRRLFVE